MDRKSLNITDKSYNHSTGTTEHPGTLTWYFHLRNSQVANMFPQKTIVSAGRHPLLIGHRSNAAHLVPASAARSLLVVIKKCSWLLSDVFVLPQGWISSTLHGKPSFRSGAGSR